MSLEDQLYPLLKVYERMPAGFKNLAGTLYRKLPLDWRYGKNYCAFAELARAGESWSPRQIEEYQDAQLRLVLAHAAEACPFYAERFAAAGFSPGKMSPQDLTRCPLLEKKDLLDRLPDLVSRKIPAAQRLYITTGGSTGVPVGFYLQKGVSRPKEQAFFEAIWERAGYFPGARVAVIRGHVTSSRESGPIHSYDATRGWLMLSSYHLTASRIPEYLERLEKFRPEFLHIYPSAALLLAEYLEASSQKLRTPLQALLCGSERLAIPQKRLLEKTFGCRVFRWYGHSERVVQAAEGRTSEWFYFAPHYGYAEFGPPDAEGFREVIGTSFHNLAMPLIRYRTGDYVRLAPAAAPAASKLEQPQSETQSQNQELTPSELTQSQNQELTPSEFPWPAAVEIAGREHEFLVTASGRKISLTAFNMHDAIFDQLYAVQFYQEEPGRAEFRYLPGPDFHRSRLAAIEAGIRRKLGDDFRLEMRQVQEVEKTARGKHRWVVSRLGG